MSPLGIGRRQTERGAGKEDINTNYWDMVVGKEATAQPRLESDLNPTELGNYYAETGTWGEVFKSPEVREALGAVIRTLINAGITAGEFVPVIGEVVSWGADAGKTLHRVMTAFGLGKYNFSNTSPDVPWVAAVGSEGLDLATGTALPSHALETGWQFKADLPRIKQGINAAREIRRRGYDSYLANRTEVDDAINTFLE